MFETGVGGSSGAARGRMLVTTGLRSYQTAHQGTSPLPPPPVSLSVSISVSLHLCL